jgi:hypothetical protein
MCLHHCFNLYESYVEILLFLCSGMVELLTRLATLGKFTSISSTGSNANSKDDVAHVEFLLRIMDASGGKEKLIRSNRRSIAVRAFCYSR